MHCSLLRYFDDLGSSNRRAAPSFTSFEFHHASGARRTVRTPLQHHTMPKHGKKKAAAAVAQPEPLQKYSHAALKVKAKAEEAHAKLLDEAVAHCIDNNVSPYEAARLELFSALDRNQIVYHMKRSKRSELRNSPREIVHHGHSGAIEVISRVAWWMGGRWDGVVAAGPGVLTVA